jgi:hypothetical protein
MKKILPVALAAVLLAGCGSANSFSAPRVQTGGVSALSKAVAEKAVRGMFRQFFTQADADKSGFLSVEEMPAAVGTTEPGEPVDPMPFKKAMFEKLDVNKNGRVTFNEFATKENVANITSQFRNQVGVTFARLDANGDRMLTAEEMESAPAPLTLEGADKNKNGKVTLSELENAMSAVLAGGGGFGPAPAPAPPAEEPVTPPADPDAPAQPDEPVAPPTEG